jgi:hypothetical protein
MGYRVALTVEELGEFAAAITKVSQFLGGLLIWLSLGYRGGELPKFLDSERHAIPHVMAMEYRLLVLNTIESPDPVLCGELEDEKARKTTYFLGSVGLFVVSGVGGLVMVLPYETRDPKQPPPGRELR